jgi:hypothetical protein
MSGLKIASDGLQQAQRASDKSHARRPQMNPDHNPRSRRAFVKTASAAAAALALPARAQSDFPRGPVKVIVGLPPGGAADIIARTIGTQMEKTLKQPVVIENKPGGQFVISVQALLNAPADGQTLLYIYNGYASVNATLKLFDLEKQTIPVAQVASTPIVLLVRNDSPHKSARELFAWARANPEKLNFATLGAGGVEHLKWRQMESAVGFKGNPVAYKGGPDSMQALLKGKGLNTISLVIPALNEAETIGAIVTTVREELMVEQPLIDEIVVIDGASSDEPVSVFDFVEGSVLLVGGLAVVRLLCHCTAQQFL